MLKMNLRIGTKLGISAGVGVLLVGSMVISQQIGGNSVARAVADTDRQDAIARDLLAAERDFQIVRGLNRGLRLATSVEEVGKFFDQVKAETGNAIKHIDDAMANAAVPGTPQGIVQGKARVSDYLAAVTEIAAARRETFALITKRQENDAAWAKEYQALMSSAALTRGANRHDLESELRHASEVYAESRIAAWRFMALGETGMLAQMNQATDQAVAALTKARGVAADKSTADAIDRLLRIVAESKAISDQIFAVGTRQARIEREPATAAAKEAVVMLGKAAGIAVRQSKAKGEEAKAEITRAGRIGSGVGGFVVLVLIGSALFGARSIGTPVRKIGEVLRKLADGDKAVDVPYTARGDEVGEAAQAAKTFKENLLRLERMETEQRDAEARASAARAADMHKLADRFETAVGSIVHSVSSAASATEELTATVGEVARRAQESSKIAGEAVQQAEKTDTRIAELSQAASRIGDVVKLITAIAEQTNLLALNATIEAARAGEAGRGFAVVAQEVKALASQTAKATEDIGSQIASMQTATRDSVTAIKEISGTIGRISEIASTIAAAVEEQGAATQEIARNVQQAADGTAEVAANISEVSKSAADERFAA